MNILNCLFTKTHKLTSKINLLLSIIFVAHFYLSITYAELIPFPTTIDNKTGKQIITFNKTTCNMNIVDDQPIPKDDWVIIMDNFITNSPLTKGYLFVSIPVILNSKVDANASKPLEGSFYQCTELVNRYLQKTFNVDYTDKKDLRIFRMQGWVGWNFHYEKTIVPYVDFSNNDKPKSNVYLFPIDKYEDILVGDIVVQEFLSGKHVAIVKGINDKEITLCEQNMVKSKDNLMHYHLNRKVNFSSVKLYRMNVVGCLEYDPPRNSTSGWDNSGKSRAFHELFKIHKEKIGYPFNNGGGKGVHWWNDYKNVWSGGVWAQDFIQPNLNLPHFGTDGQSAIIYNEDKKEAYLVCEGFWGWYKENHGYSNLGAPLWDENKSFVTGSKQEFQKGWLEWNRGLNKITGYYNNGTIIMTHDIKFVSYSNNKRTECSIYNNGKYLGDTPLKLKLYNNFNYEMVAKSDISEEIVSFNVGTNDQIITVGNMPELPSPSDLRINSVGYTEIIIRWTGGGNPDNPNFRVFRNTTGNQPTTLDEIIATPYFGWGDQSLQSGKTYYYWVKAVDGGRISKLSNMTSATTKILNPPSQFIIDSLSSFKVKLKWNKNADADRYRIFRDDYFIDSTKFNIDTSFCDCSVKPGETYRFKIASYKYPLMSEFSEILVTIPISSKNVGISFSGNGSISQSGIFAVDIRDTVTVAANPDYENYFVRWECSDSIEIINGTKSGQFIVNGNGTIKAIFEKTIELYDNWSWRNPLPQGNDLNQIIWTGNQYVAVGYRGTILTSLDGDKWAFRNSGVLNTLYSIVWNGFQMVAVGANGIILKSYDGIVWKKQIINNALDFKKIIWAENQFVCVGYSGVIITSPDAITWTQQSSGTNQNLNSASYNESKIVIVGDFGNILISNDGINWEDSIIPDIEHFNDITWNGIKFVAVGKDGLIFTSFDGLTWQKQTVSGNNYTYNFIIWDGSRFIITSQDGTILESSGGINWNLKKIESSQDLKAIVSNNNQYVIVGRNGLIFYSNDRVQWAQKTVGTQKKLTAICFNNNQIVAIGDSGTIVTSNDGYSWYKRNSGTVIDLKAIIWDGTRFITTGIPSNGATNTPVLVSSDGITWSTIVSLNASFHSILFDGTKYLLGVDDGRFYSSTNLTDWQGITTPASSSINSIRYTGSIYVAVGDNGTIIRSVDGNNWFSQSSTVTSDLYSIEWNGSKFVVVGEPGNDNTGTILISTDGINWAKTVSGITQHIYNVKWIKNRFVAVAWGPQNILTSFDGLNWTPRISKTTKDLYDLISVDTQIIFIGNGGTILSTINPEYDFVPFLYNIGNKNVTIGDSLSFTLYGTVLDNIALKYSLQPLPKGSTFDSISGDFRWTPVDSQIGTRTLLCKVIKTNNISLTDSEFVTINIKPVLPNPVVLLSPPNYSKDVSSDLNLIWNKANNSSTYTLEIANDSLFTINNTLFSEISDTLKSFIGFAKNTKYYWRVQGINENGVGTGSITWSFTTNNEVLPSQVIQKFPLDNSKDQPLDLFLQWESIHNAESYTLAYSTDSIFSQNVYTIQDIRSTEIPLCSLGINKQYFWKVQAVNTEGNGLWSNVWSFLTIWNAPEQVILLSPANGANKINIDPTLNWNSVNGSTSYTLSYASDTAFTQNVYTILNIFKTSYKIDNLTNNNKYYWSVRAENSVGNGHYSDIWSFTTEQQTSIVNTNEYKSNYFQITPNPLHYGEDNHIIVNIPIDKHCTATFTIFDPLGNTIKKIVQQHIPKNNKHLLELKHELKPGIYLMIVSCATNSEILYHWKTYLGVKR